MTRRTDPRTLLAHARQQLHELPPALRSLHDSAYHPSSRPTDAGPITGGTDTPMPQPGDRSGADTYTGLVARLVALHRRLDPRATPSRNALAGRLWPHAAGLCAREIARLAHDGLADLWHHDDIKHVVAEVNAIAETAWAVARETVEPPAPRCATPGCENPAREGRSRCESCQQRKKRSGRYPNRVSA